MPVKSIRLHSTFNNAVKNDRKNTAFLKATKTQKSHNSSTHINQDFRVFFILRKRGRIETMQNVKIKVQNFGIPTKSE